MFESIITTQQMTTSDQLICMAAAIILGFIISFTYIKTGIYSKNFCRTLVIMPILISAVMILVNGNLGTSVAVLGAFSLVRFRSLQGTSRDGVNAAGGSSNGSDFGNGWNNGFTPGGGGRPGFGSQISQGSTGDYSLNIHGGNIYIDCGADGLDSNGNINMSGGNVIVFGAASGSDNTAFDYDGQFALTGGSIFGAGSSRMAMAPTASVSTQKYITLNSTVEQGKNIVVNDSSSNILFATKAIKNVNFVVYSSPELANGDNYTISATNEAVVTNVPTVEPTVEPSTKPTVEPTKKPTKTPTTGPIVEPTMEPGIEPTAEPTAEPTVEPTTEPTVEPTAEPTAEPTTAPVTKEKINVKATSKNGKYTKIKTINNEATTSYTNKNLNCGKTYYYIVKGYKNINNTATCIANQK